LTGRDITHDVIVGIGLHVQFLVQYLWRIYWKESCNHGKR